ncbi:serine/threonine-protein kinase [Candidatus Laterigemmans baculatus]|uniref:serine/threonine-protein kinase n=1 Tax=Candidatus Laterigemmans baculatus TaxID=2770505 RepID=UPI0013D91ECD|nr:serine/threonine-protein kinase [Candidatus Laterigemmans baculatus]
MLSTTRHDPNATVTYHGTPRTDPQDNELLERYQELISARRLNWTGHYRLGKMLGSGGQGRVFLSACRGTDNFTLPVAVKFFSPHRYANVRQYEQAMRGIAGVAARVALIQHDNLLDVHNFVDRNRIRMMVMEWIDGYDLRELMRPEYLSDLNGRVEARRWRYINEVILTAGPAQSRFKAGVAVAIVRECLSALAALHREGIVHGDIKPANLMLKRTGHLKLIDIGSAFDFHDPPHDRDCTPVYAAPEVLENNESSPRSDLASLGYVLIELLGGRLPFEPGLGLRQLLAAKRELPSRLHELLPEEVTCNPLLMNFCRGLIAPDPNRRFPSAEAAEHVDQGAAAFHRQLVLSDMSTEYDNDIRVWLEELGQLEAFREPKDEPGEP